MSDQQPTSPDVPEPPAPAAPAGWPAPAPGVPAAWPAPPAAGADGAGGYVQTVPGAPPVAYGVPPMPYGAPQGAAGYAPPPAPRPAAPAGSRLLGILALVLAGVGVFGATLLSAATGFAASAGAARHAIGLSPDQLDTLSQGQLLSLLSPVRDLVLWAEIGFWTGTALGVAALVMGIIAIVTRRGRGFGIAAVIVAAVGPVIYGTIVAFAALAGMGAGAS